MKTARTWRPRKLPVTIPTCGPLKTSEQALPAGTGAKGAARRSSLRQALSGLGSVPPAGLQRSVKTRGLPIPSPFAHSAKRKSVRAAASAAEGEASRSAKMARKKRMLPAQQRLAVLTERL